MGVHLHRLDAGAYDVADNNPWDAGIEWNYINIFQAKHRLY